VHTRVHALYAYMSVHAYIRMQQELPVRLNSCMTLCVLVWCVCSEVSSVHMNTLVYIYVCVCLCVCVCVCVCVCMFARARERDLVCCAWVSVHMCFSFSSYLCTNMGAYV